MRCPVVFWIVGFSDQVEVRPAVESMDSGAQSTQSLDIWMSAFFGFVKNPYGSSPSKNNQSKSRRDNEQDQSYLTLNAQEIPARAVVMTKQSQSIRMTRNGKHRSHIESVWECANESNIVEMRERKKNFEITFSSRKAF